MSIATGRVDKNVQKAKDTVIEISPLENNKANAVDSNKNAQPVIKTAQNDPLAAKKIESKFAPGDLIDFSNGNTRPENKKLARINLDQDLTVLVPEQYTVKDIMGIDRVMQFPVREGKTNYDAHILLQKQDPRAPSIRPMRLEFNQELYNAKGTFFSQLLTDNKNIFSSLYHKEAKQLVERFAGAVSPQVLEEANTIKEKASWYSVEIKHESPELVPSIAVEETSLFNSRHLAGILGTGVQMSLPQALNVAFNGVSAPLTWVNYIPIPIIAYVTSKASHAPSYDIRSMFLASDHHSLPPFLLYCASGAGFFVANSVIKSYAVSVMQDHNVPDAGVTAVAIALPVGMGVFLATSPAMVRGIAKTVVATGACLQTCAYGVVSLFKACGSKLWNSGLNNKGKDVINSASDLHSELLKASKPPV